MAAYALNALYFWPQVISPAGPHSGTLLAKLASALEDRLSANHNVNVAGLPYFVAGYLLNKTFVDIAGAGTATAAAIDSFIPGDVIKTPPPPSSAYQDLGGNRHEGTIAVTDASGSPIEWTLEVDNNEYVVHFAAIADLQQLP